MKYKNKLGIFGNIERLYEEATKTNNTVYTNKCDADGGLILAEQTITDLDLANIQAEQTITDLDLRVLELESREV